MRRLIILATAVLDCTVAMAQSNLEADTLMVERRNNQNVLLNASSDSQPRMISLGIPQWGVPILDDGLPTAMYNDFFPGFWSWRSGLGTESLQLTMLDESALELGDIGFYAMTESKTGTDNFEGAVKYAISNHGRQQLDLNLASPIGRGWGFNLNLYQDLNPGPNHLDLSYLQEHIQHYKTAISKKFNQGLFFANYLYSKKFSVADPYGPFIFIGNGKIKEYDGFRLGKNQYLPSTPTLDYIDVETGQSETMWYIKDGGIPASVFTAGFKWNFTDNLTMDINSRLRLIRCNLTESHLNAIETADSNSGYTYIDGTPYIGKVQTRYLIYNKDKLTEWFTTARLRGILGKSQWVAGINAWFNRTKNNVATTNFAHEATKNPAHLLYDNQMYYVPNTGAQYVDGRQNRLAAFFKQQWMFSNKFSFRYGIRLEYSHIGGNGANNVNGLTNNTRTAGWNLENPDVTITPFDTNNINGSATLVAHYMINDRWGLELNAVTTRQHAELWQYGEADLPTPKPKMNYLVRGGVNFKNKFLDIQSLLMFYQRDNNFYTALWTHELDRPVNGYPAGYKESIYIGSLYSMRVLAWTTDFILAPFKGFSLHGMFTLRSPKYSRYYFKPTFSDGFSEEFDFSGKQITESSAIEIEIEPSYTIGHWMMWASARYYSKQYVNITNSLLFKSRWETFAGVQYRLNDKVGFGIDVVNFLNQTGANAGIQSASLAEDPSPFKNYLTSGTYLRPFTVELSTSISF